LGVVFFWALMRRLSGGAGVVGLGVSSLAPRWAAAGRGLARASNQSRSARTCARCLQRVHVLAEGLAAGQAAHGPADVLARAAHAAVFAVEA
jgi:hypothetical protein